MTELNKAFNGDNLYQVIESIVQKRFPKIKDSSLNEILKKFISYFNPLI